MRYHQCGEIVACDDLFGDLQHLICGFRIERCGMLVEQQQIRLAQGGHQQGQCLTLTAGQQTDLTGHAVLQSQTERCQLFAIQLAFLVRNAGAEAALLTAAVCQRQILLDAHGSGSTHHRVLKYPAEETRALMLGQIGQVVAVQMNHARIHRIHACDQVQRGGLAGAVTADDGNEIAVLKGQVQVVNGTLFVYRARVEGLVNPFELQHVTWPPSHQSLRHSWLHRGNTCPSSTEQQGRLQRRKPRSASGRWCSGRG